MTRMLMPLLVLLVWSGHALDATAQIGTPTFTFQICVKIDILTTDSGLTANGITEDQWVGANDPVQYLVIGRGFRVKVRQGTWVQTFDSDPETGCFTFQRLSSQGFAVRVYGFATDSAGNHVRIHNAGWDTSSWYPGATYSQVWTNQTLSSSQANIYVLDGRAADRWTTIAAAAYGIRRYHNGNSGKTISIGFADEGSNPRCGTSCCNSSGSIHGNAENYIESREAHLFRIGRCSSTASDAREKMIVTHELGHAMLRLYYGFNGDDAPRNQSYQPPVDGTINAASPPQGGSCFGVSVSSYGMNSLEWNSQAFKEAYADFYSAKVWNVKAARGTYTYRGIAYDLEKWDNVGDSHAWGGFTVNWCGSTADSVTTKGDMLRFLWDFYTVAGCASQPTKLDMMRIYRAVRENHRDGTYALTISNYDEALKYAIENSVPSLSGCEKAAYEAYAGWNGVF